MAFGDLGLAGLGLRYRNTFSKKSKDLKKFLNQK
jgi:hypothetical protein